MDINGFCSLLDKKNPWASELVALCRFLEKRNELVIEKKGESLVEVVQKFWSKKLYPVVDKNLKLVFETKSHELLRTHLFRYQYYAGDPEMEKPRVGPDESASCYVSEGLGYFISAMRPTIIVVGRKYRLDSFDKDLFMIYKPEFWES